MDAPARRGSSTCALGGKEVEEDRGGQAAQHGRCQVNMAASFLVAPEGGGPATSPAASGLDLGDGTGLGLVVGNEYRVVESGRAATSPHHAPAPRTCAHFAPGVHGERPGLPSRCFCRFGQRELVEK